MLPKIEYPVFEVYLKSLNKKIKFRPFLVKEEKLLLMAKEAEDLPTLLQTVKQIINNCMLEENIKVESLPLFDIEMIFIHLRLRSVGENLELTYKCENVINEQSCSTPMTFEVDLNGVEFQVPEGHTNKIMITDTVGISLKYPSLETSTAMAENPASLENIVEMVAEHLDYIFDENQKYKAEEIDEDELNEFLGSLSLENVESFKDFFNTLPYVKTEKKITCGNCGFNHTIVIEGIEDFFG